LTVFICIVLSMAVGHWGVGLDRVTGLAVLAWRVKRPNVQELDYRPPYLDDDPVRLALSVDL